jgi:hypothetical protein
MQSPALLSSVRAVVTPLPQGAARPHRSDDARRRRRRVRARLPLRTAAWLMLALVAALALGLASPNGATARLPLSQCEDGIDNDHDGKIDAPFDPGCTTNNPNPNTAGNDDTEADPAILPACSDGVAPDFPAAFQCEYAGESIAAGAITQCSDSADNAPLNGLMDFAPLAPALPDPNCLWAADPFETTRACSNGIDDDGDGFKDWPADIGCPNPNNNNEANLPQCNDGRDNDNNGFVDFGPGPRDPGCTSATDTTEVSPPAPGPATTQCSDTVDNDGDGKVDYPNDPGCTSRADTDEADPLVPTACSDGIDNDSDLRIDLADPGCSSASDNDEFNTITFITPQGQVVKRIPLLTPFPIIRMRGAADKRGVRISLLTVRAPATSTVSIYCTGPSCPRKRVVITAGKAVVRARQFEKRLRSGTILKIYVTKSGYMGKYTRFRLVRNRPPLRADRCATTPGTRPHACPES